MASSNFNPAGSGPVSAPSASPSPSAAPAASPTAPGPAAPSASPSGAPPASPTGTGTGAPPATPTGTAPQSTPNPNADNIEVLRQSHETLRGLGDLNQVREGLGIYTKAWTEAQSLAKSLNYTPESLQQAFKDDPVGTVAFLRNEAATARTDPANVEAERIREAVRRETQPLTEHLARQMADKHNQTIDSEFNTMFNANEAFKARNGIECPPEVRGIIRDRFIETIKWNNDLLKEVTQGKVSGLRKVFDEVAADTLAGWNKYQSWGTPSNGQGQGQPSTGQGQGQRDASGRFVPAAPKGFEGTLDDIIEGTAKADALPSMRGFK